MIDAMPKWTASLALSVAIAGSVYGQGGRGGVDWTTTGNDAQRSNWVKADPKISIESMRKPGFQLLWKVKLATWPSQPMLLDRYIGYRGFRSLAFAGTASDKIFALDTDLGRVEWQMQLKGAPAQVATATCAGGMTSALTRPTSTAFVPVGAAAGGRGRGGPAKSGVGDPGQGAITLAAAPAPARGGPPPDAAGGRRGGGGGGRQPAFVHALTSDGMFHTMYVSNGVEPEPPVQFLPPNANAQGLIVIDDVAYVSTSGGCGGVPDGVWALDMAAKKVASWKPASGKIAGTAGPAFGPDGTVYVTTTSGELAALEARTLKPKSFVAKQSDEFTSSPLVFEFNDKVLVVATTASGLRVFDAASLSTVLAQGTSAANTRPGALASWQDSAGTRWLLAPTGDVVTAWKVTGEAAKPSLLSGWVSRELATATTPMVVNGVVFAVSGGGPRRSARGVLYSLDGATGKELWSSGSAITSAAHAGGLSAGGSQMYVGTYDGTLYAFGFPIEH
jgi:outer membrane protein assembly factor BamB